MDISLTTHRDYIGRPALELPTPSLVLSKSVVEKNINQLLQDVSDLGISFRAHIKTLKSLEVTRMMLAGGQHKKIVASTLCEIRGALPLVQEGLLEECLYGLPVYPSVLPQLLELSKSIKILLIIDNEQHVRILEEFAQKNPGIKPWSVFIKIDVGSHRAGVMATSPALPKLIEKVESSPAVSVYGFYCHAGHSYSSQSTEEAAAVLQTEVDGVVKAALMMPQDRSVVVSVGATPTAHVVKTLKAAFPANVKLELHAGNFPANDLQQVATGLVTESQQAVRVLAEVCSVYDERNEVLINAGCIAISKETGRMPGYARVVEHPKWNALRLSQEHGILARPDGEKGPEAELAVNTFHIGQKLFLHIQHACITSAAYYVYYVVDDNDVVIDTWIPWKGW